MSEVVIHAQPWSGFTRGVLMVCAHKGIPHRLEVIEMGSAEHLERHPFGRVPSIQHGDTRLFETLAIVTYLEDVFPDRRLLPDAPADRAKVLQWISAINHYVVDSIMIGCVIERLAKPMRGLQADEAVIANAAPAIAQSLDVLNENLSSNKYLSGEEITLADMILAPLLYFFSATPEGQAELPKRPALCRWQKDMASLPYYDDINKLG